MSIGKWLENGFKNVSAVMLRFFLAQPAREPHPPYKRILFIRYGRIGDVILSLPVFRAARARFPDSEIDVLCDAQNARLLISNELIDNVYFYQKLPHRIARLIGRLHRKNYDYICNLGVYPSFTFGILARLIGPKAVRTAGDQGRFSYFYNRSIKLPPKREIHMLERLFLLAADISGSKISNISIPWVKYNHNIQEKARQLFKRIVPTALSGLNYPRVVAVNISAGLERREWPVDKFREFMKLAVKKYRRQIDGWVIFTDPQNPAKAAQFTRSLNSRSLTQLPPENDFRILMEFLRHIYVLITPDTSFAHAASAMGTPVLDLVIGENSITWDPIGVPHQVVLSEDPLSLEKIPVEAVEDGFEKLMESIRGYKPNYRQGEEKIG